MGYIGAGISRFNTADELTVTGDAVIDTTTLVVDSTNNRVGIGTSSPSSVLHLSTSNDPKITLTDTGFGASADITGSNGNLRLNSTTATLFDMAGSEVSRFNSSGDLLVGKTSAATSTAGVQLASNGRVEGVVDGGEALRLNRITSNGDIAVFRKDNTTVGSIGVDSDSTNLMIGNGVVGLRFVEGSNHIRPANIDTGGNRDNAIDLGYGSSRFKELYLSGGVYLGGTGSAN